MKIGFDWTPMGCYRRDVRYLVRSCDYDRQIEFSLHESTNGLHIPPQLPFLFLSYAVNWKQNGLHFKGKVSVYHSLWSTDSWEKMEASVKHLRYFVWCRLLTCPKTWLKASSLVLFFWSDFSTLSDYSHLWKRHLKEWTGVKKYKQRGNKKKGSLWQKTRTEKTDSLYKWGGWRNTWAKEERGDKRHLQQVFSSLIHFSLRGQGLYPHINTHTPWTVDSSSQGVKVTMQLCFYRCVFCGPLWPNHQTLEAFRPAQSQIQSLLHMMSIYGASHRRAEHSVKKHYLFCGKRPGYCCYG